MLLATWFAEHVKSAVRTLLALEASVYSLVQSRELDTLTVGSCGQLDIRLLVFSRTCRWSRFS